MREHEWYGALVTVIVAARRRRQGVAPLAIAAQRGHGAVVRLLLTRGSRVNHFTSSASPALVGAVRHGHIDVVEMLLRAGADPDCRHPSGYPALVAAVLGLVHGIRNGGHDPNLSLMMIDMLIRAGSDPLVTDARGMTARMHAAFHLYQERGLIQGLSRPGQSAHIRDAAAGGDVTAIEVQLASGALADETGKDGGTALLWASLAGSQPAVEHLLQAGADPAHAGPNGVRPIDSAAGRGHAGVVKILLGHDGATEATLSIAAMNNQVDVMGLLLDRGIAATAQTLTDAAKSGHMQSIKLLLEAGAPINQLNATGGTALHSAVANGHGDVVAFLLANGADPSVRDHKGRTAHALASAGGEMEIAEFLSAYPHPAQRDGT